MKVKNRDSSIELLRIISIIMVIISHYCVHGGFNLLSVDNANLNIFLVQILHLGTIANHIFIIITGYFMVESKPKYNKVIQLILELTFYSLFIAVLFNSLGIVEIGLKGFVKAILPIFWGNWFVIYYIILYLLSPYLNIFINQISQKKLRNCIILMSFLFYLIPTLTKNVWNINEHQLFILNYLIGAYIKLYYNKSLDEKIKPKRLLLITTIIYVFISLLLYFIGTILKSEIILTNINYLIGFNYSILSVIFAILLFLTFNQINIKSNKYINSIAASVLGIYIIHENHDVRHWIWKVFWPNTLYIDSEIFVIHMIVKVSLVFIICLLIDKVRILLLGKIEKKLTEKIYMIIVNTYNKLKKFVMKEES